MIRESFQQWHQVYAVTFKITSLEKYRFSLYFFSNSRFNSYIHISCQQHTSGSYYWLIWKTYSSFAWHRPKYSWMVITVLQHKCLPPVGRSNVKWLHCWSSILPCPSVRRRMHYDGQHSTSKQFSHMVWSEFFSRHDCNARNGQFSYLSTNMCYFSHFVQPSATYFYLHHTRKPILALP